MKHTPFPLSFGSATATSPPIGIPEPHRIRRHRAIFISDVHLGTAGCKAELLADFLAYNDCQTLYLVGDIVDGWRLKVCWYWPEAHSRVIAAILQKVANGTKVIYVPGNHDEVLRDYCGVTLAGVQVVPEAMHRSAEGKEFLVLHGDQFDGLGQYARWFMRLGDWAYQLVVHLNEAVALVRRRMGLSYWSLSTFLKRKVKDAASFIANFETAMAREARERGADGVICGHIHCAAIRTIDGVLYCNDGDWVESCTALTEDWRGRFQIMHWNQVVSESEVKPVQVVTDAVARAAA